ncbi:hypothetical protein V8F20_006993 [Naviculisporaceae sp. PSN 640]
MIVSRILAACLLAVSALGAPPPVVQDDSPEPVGYWMLEFVPGYKAPRWRFYTLELREDLYGEVDLRCTLLAFKDEPRSMTLSNCTGDENYELEIDVSHGFTTLTVMNTVKKTWARIYFKNWYKLPQVWFWEDAYSYEKQSDIPPFELPTDYDPEEGDDEDEWDFEEYDTKDEDEDGSAGLMVRGDVESDEDEFWQIRGMQRIATEVGLTYLRFTIVLPDGKLQYCNKTIYNTKPDSSFSSIPCGDSGFTFSWGYKEDTDGGIMTICNPTLHKFAWFGWDHVGRRIHLPDSPRNAVTTGECK